MKMILADDEPVITRGIQKLVDWRRLGIQVVGEYADGKSALEGLLRERPELALLDISMPGMSGVEILKECRAVGLPTKIIFISGFQEFAYVKAALQYGAVDYLLKPVIREELLGAVEKCLSALPAPAQGRRQPEERPADYGALVQQEDTFYVPLLAEALCQNRENQQVQKLIRFSLLSFFEEYLEQHPLGIAFRKNDHVGLILKGMERPACKEAAARMQRAYLEGTGQRVAFVIGQRVPNMRGIPQAFTQCLGMQGYFFFAGQVDTPIFLVGEPVFPIRVEEEKYVKARESLLEAALRQDGPLFARCFAQFAKLVCWMADGKKEDACFYFCSAIRLLGERLQALKLEGGPPDMKGLLERGRGSPSYDTLLQTYREVLLGYMEKLQRALAQSDKKYLLKALSYIEAHYAENLTLEVLARECHMNPYYFSSFFKKSSGENFKETLCKVRISHAVPLLLSTGLKTYEIACRVGFGDARSFSDAFQRLYHETPSAFRRRAAQGKGGPPAQM